MARLVQVLVKTPAHSQIAGPLSYLSEQPLSPGTLVRVPLGQRETIGLVWEGGSQTPSTQPTSEKLRPITAVLDLIAPLSSNW